MPAGYNLEPTVFTGVLETIEREYRSARLSGFQRRCFRWLRAAAYGLTLIVVAIVALEVLPSALKPISVVLQVVGTLVAIAVVLLLVLNAPLISKAVRQARLASRLRLLEIADAFWIRGARSRPSPTLKTAVYLGPSALILLLFLASLVFGPADQRLAVTWGQTALVLAVCCGLPFGLHAVDRLLERLRDRLDHLEEIEILRRELERLSAEAGEGPLEVAPALAQRLADMERIHMLRRQASAVADAERGDPEGFSVGRTPSFRRDCRELSSPERQRVEETILELAHEARAEPGGEPRVRPVTQTDLALRYTVSTTDRRVEITALIRTDTGGEK